jgi:hypothetical protein
MLFRFGSGDDFALGGPRNDVVLAGAGNDTVDGGRGQDYLQGGLGEDVFVFGFHDVGRRKVADPRDHVLDFEDGQDLIDLSGFLVGVLDVQGAAFIGAEPFEQSWSVQVRAVQAGPDLVLQVAAPDALPRLPGSLPGQPRVVSEIVLHNTSADEVSEADFIFSG